MDYMEINGWKFYFHACFSAQVTSLAQEVLQLRVEKPHEYHKKKQTKLPAAIYKVVTEVIARDPLNPQFRQGGTLGDENRYWFRAKFLQQFRLFFRCSEQSKTIILGWVNDFGTLRAYESKNDAYKTFKRMLDAGHPPSDWEQLLRESTGESGFLFRAPFS